MKDFFNLRQNKAFTLAEVLITLGIIGVIAALTIPTLMNNVQDAQFKTKWKKVFSNIANVTKLMTNDNGGSLAGVFANDSDYENKILPYLYYSKTCTGSTCWVVGKTITNYPDTWLPSYYSSWPVIVLNDGTQILVRFSSTACTDANAATGNGCVILYVDVNGAIEPNVQGKDQFSLLILENGSVAPMGTDNDFWARTFPCPNNTDTFSCSAKALMNINYP